MYNIQEIRKPVMEIMADKPHYTVRQDNFSTTIAFYAYYFVAPIISDFTVAIWKIRAANVPIQERLNNRLK